MFFRFFITLQPQKKTGKRYSFKDSFYYLFGTLVYDKKSDVDDTFLYYIRNKYYYSFLIKKENNASYY